MEPPDGLVLTECRPHLQLLGLAFGPLLAVDTLVTLPDEKHPGVPGINTVCTLGGGLLEHSQPSRAVGLTGLPPSRWDTLQEVTVWPSVLWDPGPCHLWCPQRQCLKGGSQRAPHPSHLLPLARGGRLLGNRPHLGLEVALMGEADPRRLEGRWGQGSGIGVNPCTAGPPSSRGAAVITPPSSHQKDPTTRAPIGAQEEATVIIREPNY